MAQPGVKCGHCNKPVYPIEPNFLLDGRKYHQACAKCRDCGRQLSAIDYGKSSDFIEESFLLCKLHYQERFLQSKQNFIGKWDRSSRHSIRMQHFKGKSKDSHDDGIAAAMAAAAEEEEARRRQKLDEELLQNAAAEEEAAAAAAALAEAEAEAEKERKRISMEKKMAENAERSKEALKVKVNPVIDSASSASGGTSSSLRDRIQALNSSKSSYVPAPLPQKKADDINVRYFGNHRLTKSQQQQSTSSNK